MISAAFALLLALSSQSMAAQGPPVLPPTQISPAAAPAAATTYVPERVFLSDKKRFTDFEALLADLQVAAVVFVGEQHDDPNTHRLELAVMDGLARRRGSIILSLEMFERDVQARLDAYLGDTITEEEFLKQSRPWPLYKSDYRALVELAKARGWKVVASNVPRTLASGVNKTGLDFLKTLTDEQKAWVASDLRCPFDDYFENFAETMYAHPMPGDEKKSLAEKKQTTERFYFAQCLNRMFGPYAWAYWTMVSCNVIFPQFFWFKKIRRSIPAMMVIVLFVNVGMWFERFVIVVTSLHRDFLPSSWGMFTPTLYDAGILLGSFGLFFTLVILFTKALPVISIAEVKADADGAQPKHHRGEHHD